MLDGKSGRRTTRLVALALCAAAALGLSVADALAQGWGWWPWSQPEPRRIERDPVYGRRCPARCPPASRRRDRCLRGQMQPPPGQVPGYGGQRMSNLCLQLEQRLVGETQGSNQGRELLPKIENDMRTIERNYRTAQLQLSRADCWDQFLFSRTLRRTPRCVQLAGEVDSARQRLADLEAQRRQIMGTGERRSYQDDIIRELARNNCGPQYQQEARRRDASRNPFPAVGGGERGPGGNPTSSATCRLRPTGRCACGCATAIISPSASRRCPTISRAMRTCANRNARRRPSCSITRTPAGRSSRWCR